MKQVLIFKLVAGPEVIAYVENDGFAEYTLGKPHLIQLVPQQGNHEALQCGMMSLLMMAKEDVLTILKNQVQYSYEPNPQIVKQYQNATSSILQPMGPALIKE